MSVEWDDAALMRSIKTRKFLVAAAARVEAEAKRRAPVRTGRLKNSIHTVLPGSTKFGVRADDMTAYVGTNVEYAIFQEMGFTHRAGTVVPGQWYLRGALETLRTAGWQIRYGVGPI